MPHSNSFYMKKIHFQIEIDCPKEKVYSTMIDKDQYSQWTALFNPTSHYEGSWDEGSKILFLGETEDGEKGGMHSMIAKNKPNEFISIKHIGMLEKGKETKFVDVFYENYTFEDSGKGTLLKVEMDSEDEWVEYMDSTWPKALQKLKEICEVDC